MNARRSLGLVGLSTAAALLSASQTGWAQEPADDVQLRIVSASYGAPDATNAKDFSARLQKTCGDHAVACQSFCSPSGAGAPAGLLPGLVPGLRIPFTPRPVCRIVYHCGEGLTRATETDEGDIIALNCKTNR